MKNVKRFQTRHAHSKQIFTKHAFTLAEVLIALAIIGVIAATTVPTLIQKTQKQEYVSALKKAYSTLSQAANMIIAENGSPKCKDESGNKTGWACSAEEVYNMYKKYLINAKECGSASGCFEQNIKTLNNGNENWNAVHSWYRLVLSDGMQVMFYSINEQCSGTSRGSSNPCAEIVVDINGAKKPNINGVDIQRFILKENGLFPAGCDTTEDVCSKNNRGDGCACKVLREGAMNY